YGPVPDSTYFDFSGGWHDAADQLQYLITSSNATARMLLAYEMAPDLFGDAVDDYGRKGANGLPDVLDEARWGLEWMLKLHPKEDWLIHQIADDRDHRGFKFPDKDHSDYGWGPNSYRPAYFANGKPQGLGKWKSKATGIANVAGRSAAAMAIGARVWKQLGTDQAFVLRLEKAAHELYRMGKKQEGYQQGNSYDAPYRYNEDSWEDDMEWAAAELFRLSKDQAYLEDAIHYAYLIKDDGWMARDTMSHYQKYPFMNMGHYALYQVAPDTVKPQLANWYRANIEKVLKRSETNAFQVGVPFLWCSSNLMVNFVTQVQLYERMTGDQQYHATMLLHRDWLFGRNPWGTTMFTGIPRNGETPLDVHLGPTVLLGDTPPGGLIDGPIYRTIHNYLKGLTLNDPDEFAEFQNDFIVYHDDIGDYSTNEPTMDGTADSIFMMALLNSMKK
ncbi:MAG: glycoside hydrolase family 9 protein, partial [Bacteroidota bacterium]